MKTNFDVYKVDRNNKIIGYYVLLFVFRAICLTNADNNIVFVLLW